MSYPDADPRFFTSVFSALVSAALLGIPSFGKPAPKQDRSIRLELMASHKPAAASTGGAEISAYDRKSKRLFVTNAGEASLAVVDLSNPALPATVATLTFGTTVTSVAVHNGLVAVGVPASPKTDPGKVVFFRADFPALATPSFQEVGVGALPDMVVFTPDGLHLLVANEGEPKEDYTVDPEGSVSIIDVKTCGRRGNQPKVRTVRFSDFNVGGPRAAELPSGVRAYGPNATLAQDLEPEYIALSPDGRLAYVTLQEANAIAVIDVRSARVKRIAALGFKDFSLEGNAFDASDKDKAINIRSWPVSGLFLPDGIASFKAKGRTYLITGNEGDTRDYPGFSEEVRVKNLTLDPVVFPNATELKKDPALGRLKVTRTLGDIDGDGDYDALYAFGGRSFSIWDAGMNQVFDGGDEFERYFADNMPGLFNSDNEANLSFDSRSASKGPEPENVATAEIKGRIYAFIGLERIGGIMVYDVTEPVQPFFVQYVNSRNFDGDVAAGTAGDVGPEGVLYIAKQDSPNHKALLIVSNETSGTVAIYRVEE